MKGQTGGKKGKSTVKNGWSKVGTKWMVKEVLKLIFEEEVRTDDWNNYRAPQNRGKCGVPCIPHSEKIFI